MKTPMYFDVFVCFFVSMLIHVPVSILVAQQKMINVTAATKTAPQKKSSNRSIQWGKLNGNSRSEAEHELTALAFIRLLGAVHLVPGNGVGVDRLVAHRPDVIL